MKTRQKHIIYTLLLIFILASVPTVSAQNNPNFNNYRNQIRTAQQQYRNRVFNNLRQYRDSIFRELRYYRDSLNIPFGRELQMPWSPINIEQPLVPPQYLTSYPKDNRQFNLAEPSLPPYASKTFYGKKIKINFPSKTSFQFQSLSEKEIGKAWLHLNDCNLISPICECLISSLEMNLNGWGFYQFLTHLADQLFPENAENEKTMFCFFILNQAGYRCKIVRLNPQVLTLLLPFNGEIYHKYYFSYDGLKYYLLNASQSITQPYTYKQEFKNTKRIPDLHLQFPVLIAKDITYKKFSLSDQGDEFKCPTNKHLIDFYNAYPHCDPEIYASAALAPEIEEAIRKQFSKLHQLPNEKDKIDFLLKFIHQNFKYKPDEEYWGEERYFFPEESLFYPFVDCEDLALLFRKLVLLTLGHRVLLVATDDHMYTAVKLPGNISGDYLLYQGEKYMICDPAYLHASTGMLMPKCKGKPYRIISTN